MRFFAFQKKPLFNRGFRREILKVAIFDPPRKPPKIPFLTILAILDPPFGVTFWPLFDPPENPRKPQKRPFLTPPKTDPPQKSWKMALLAKTGVFKQDLNRKKGGGWGFTQGPPKKAIFGHFCPFLAIFGHFCHFWPFLATFWPPKMIPKFGRKMWAKLAIFGQKREKTPPETPLARQTISNNRVIRPQIWNLRRKRGFFCTPTGAGEMWVNLAAIYPLLC